MDKQHRILTTVQLALAALLTSGAQARAWTSKDGEAAGNDGKVFSAQLTIGGDSGDYDRRNAKPHMNVGLGLGRTMTKWFGGQN
ncbi:MAG: hypothetical protein ACR2RV_17735 [Verrucomicrobiales bacterium]